MHKKPLILIGGGGHCKSCIEVIESTGEWEIKGILDQPSKLYTRVLAYTVIDTDSEIARYVEQGFFFLVTVGQIKSAAIRKRIFEELKAKNAKIATVISPRATVSAYASIGEGTIVHHHCVVNAAARIGSNCIVNTGANVEHDTIIGNNTHISTHAVLNGSVTIGDECFIGSGTIASNGISIGNKITVGAGSLVLKDLIDEGVYAGSPCKKISA